MSRYAVAAAIAITFSGLPRSFAGDSGKAPLPEAIQFFESRVRPVLAENCFRCHGDKKHKGNLRLDSRTAILTGGDQGAAMVPGHPEKSLLIKAIRQDDPDLKMPPSRKLSPKQIADLSQWIKVGAPWPGGAKEGTTTSRPAEYRISDKDRAHWAFQPVKKPPLPPVKNPAWVRNPIDAFILARLEAKGLAPTPSAAKHELLRRLYYDLTGLPPPPQGCRGLCR